MQFVEAANRIEESAGSLLVVRQQEITKDFLDELHSERMAKTALRTSDHNRVAAVPTSLVNLWLAQGIPFWDMTAHEVAQKLRNDGLHAFLATDAAV